MIIAEVNEEVILSEETFLLYAMRAYKNSHCFDISDFYDDLKRIKYVKRLLNRYKKSGILKERLILNHLIILYNVFGPEHSSKMLFFKISDDLWEPLKTFLVYLHFMPDYIFDIGQNPVISDNIRLDYNILDILYKI